MTKTYTVQYAGGDPILTGASLDEAIARCHALRPDGMPCRIFDETEGAYLSAFAVEYFERHGELPDEAVYAADQTQP